MPVWGNTDAANSKPLFPSMREVRAVAQLTTANLTAAGANTITFTSNATFSSLSAGLYAYSLDANNALARFFDTSIVDQDDVDFYRANNSIRSIDTGNTRITFANNTVAILAASQTIYFGTAINHGANAQAQFANDTILVTGTRMANTSGTSGAGGSTVANTKLGSINQGWNRITRKINSDGTVRFLKETLVALASPVASNTSSANTSANAIFGGV
jgi:hypothetical protein